MARICEWPKTFAAVVAVLCICIASFAQGRSDVGSSPFNPAPYSVGEQLTYTVSFSNFSTAAHIQMLVAGRGQLQGREGVELHAHVETTGVVSAALYALNNDYVTLVDPANGLPYRAQQTIREGARVADVTREYNAAIGDSAIPGRQVTIGSGGSYDFLSALFRLRSLPLAQGETYALVVQNGDALYNVEVKVIGRELIKTNVGSSNAIVTQARVVGNKEANDYRVRIYFSDDERHVPLLMTARHRAGEIRAELASAEILTALQPIATGPTPTPTTVQPPGTTPPPGNPPASTTPTPASGTGAAPAELPFAPGESLNFNFFLGTTPQSIGIATFHVRPRAKYFNRDGLQLIASVQTRGAGETLFPVLNQLNSYVDASTLIPFRTELNLREGDRRARWIVSADQTGGSALFDDGTRVEIPVGTHDLVSVFYALRSFDLTPGKRNAVSLLVNKRPRLLFVTAMRRASVTLGTGQPIPAVELSLITGDPDGDRFSLRLWVSTDRRRLPLRLTAQTPFGPIRADLAIIPTALN